ncbi:MULTISPECIES: hypothetical protein [Microbacterium]|uniref:hypothetical protein n=1 Tax=Microbacterium TaxID=33882 RepID=UPI00217D2995|nr:MULTISPECIES: hypothetical protein [Microbacterium]UWF77623.1 hypothetical protein JSY13_00575 [Microbacterium neungamense]WCM55794.1 hypothetical protein JRG78_00590 [Microbacterium sp. EF45047]
MLALLLALLSLIVSGWLVVIEHRRDERARERERREQATLVQAYVAEFATPDAPRRWGIVVINAGQSSVTNLLIWTRSKVDPERRANGELPTAGRYLTVPPGRYFIERAEAGAAYPWRFPVVLRDDERPQPIMNTLDWLVEKFEFADANGQCWRRTYDPTAVETGDLSAIDGSELSKPRLGRPQRR